MLLYVLLFGEPEGQRDSVSGVLERRDSMRFSTETQPLSAGYLKFILSTYSIKNNRVFQPVCRRGRRHPDDLRVGDALDFWRVEDVEHNHLIRLRAEMKLPRQSWIQFKCIPQIDGTSTLELDVIFAPKGLLGLAYWYFLHPIHRWIFNGLLQQIVKRTEEYEIQT